MVTRENAGYMSGQDIDLFAQQLNQTADSPAAEAARLDTLAGNARALAAKWKGSGYGDDAANAGAMFEELADRLDKQAKAVRNGVKNAATGDPTSRSVTDNNARYVMDADADFFKSSIQTDALPADPSQRAQRLTELANIARATAEKWSGATISATFTDNAGNVVKAGDYFRSWATDLKAAAADNQAIATRNAEVGQAKTTFTAGSRGLPATFGAPEIEGSAGFFQDHLSTVQNQRDYAQAQLDRWTGNPQDELIRIPGGGQPGREIQLRPSEYWQGVLDSLEGQKQTINTAQSDYKAEVHRKEVEYSLDHLASTRLSRPIYQFDPEGVEARGQFFGGVRGMPTTFGAPEIEGSAGYFQDHLSTVQNQRDYAQRQLEWWSGNPQDELVRLQGGGQPGQEEQLRPSGYWQRVLDSLQGRTQTINTAQQEYRIRSAQARGPTPIPDPAAPTATSRPVNPEFLTAPGGEVVPTEEWYYSRPSQELKTALTNDPAALSQFVRANHLPSGTYASAGEIWVPVPGTRPSWPDRLIPIDQYMDRRQEGYDSKKFLKQKLPLRDLGAVTGFQVVEELTVGDVVPVVNVGVAIDRAVDPFGPGGARVTPWEGLSIGLAPLDLVPLPVGKALTFPLKALARGAAGVNRGVQLQNFLQLRRAEIFNEWLAAYRATGRPPTQNAIQTIYTRAGDQAMREAAEATTSSVPLNALSRRIQIRLGVPREDADTLARSITTRSGSDLIGTPGILTTGGSSRPTPIAIQHPIDRMGGSVTSLPGDDVALHVRAGESVYSMPKFTAADGNFHIGGTQWGNGRGGGGGGGGAGSTYRTQGGVLLNSQGNILSEPPHPTSVAAVQQRLANERMANRQPAKSVDEVSADIQSRHGYAREEADDLAQYLTSRSEPGNDLVGYFPPTEPEKSILRLPPATIQRAGTQPLILPFHPTDRFALSESIPEYEPPRIQSVVAAPPAVEPSIAPYRVATPDIDSRPEPEHQTGMIWMPGQAWGTGPVSSRQMRTVSEPAPIPEIEPRPSSAHQPDIPARLIPIPAQPAAAPVQVRLPVAVPKPQLAMGTAYLSQPGAGTTTELDTNLALASLPDPSFHIPGATPHGATLNATGLKGTPPPHLLPHRPRPPSADDGDHAQQVRLPTRPGQYADGLVWVSHSLNRYDPQTDEHTAVPLSRTNVETLAIEGYTTELPQDKVVLAGNLAVETRGGNISATSVPHRSTKVDTGATGSKPKKRPNSSSARSKRKNKGRRRPDDGQVLVAPEPVLIIGR